MYFRKKVSGGRVYLQIAASRRVGGEVRERVVATLDRLDELAASGQMARLVRSGARFAARAMVLSAAQDDPTACGGSGRPWLCERLWAETGCRAAIAELARARQHDFALERAIFLTVLHRLMGGGSDLAADRWRADYRIAGVEALGLHHLYRALAWLGQELPAKEQDGRTPFAPRCTKDLIEERLFAHWRDLFSRSTSCSWTPPVCTSRGRRAAPTLVVGAGSQARAGRRLAATTTARIIGPTCPR